MILKTFENVHVKITVEEINDEFISTFWDKEKEYENDRSVKSFETFGGAMADAFDNLKNCIETHNWPEYID